MTMLSSSRRAGIHAFVIVADVCWEGVVRITPASPFALLITIWTCGSKQDARAGTQEKQATISPKFSSRSLSKNIPPSILSARHFSKQPNRPDLTVSPLMRTGYYAREQAYLR